MAAQREEQAAAARIPQPRGVIAAGRDDPPAVGLKIGERTSPSWPRKVTSTSPLATSQMRAVPSNAAVTMRSPAASKAAPHTPPWWPRSTASPVPLATSQSRAVASIDEVTTRSPRGPNAAENTQCSWPRKAASSTSLATLHSRALRSREAVTRRLQGGNAVFYTNRTASDQVAGFMRGMRHEVGRGMMRDALVESFAAIRAKLGGR